MSNRLLANYDFATHPMQARKPCSRHLKPVLNFLLQAVGVEWIAEIPVRVLVVLPQRRRRHAKLERRLEVFEDLPPVRLVAGAAPVALVYDDEVEEILRVLPVQPRSPLIPRDRLVCREVHLAAFYRFPLDL